MGLAAIMITIVPVIVIVSVRILVPVLVVMFMTRFIKMLVRIMKVDVPSPHHLANQIVNAEKQERSARDARKPHPDSFAQSCAEQRDCQSERRRHQHMASPGESGHGDSLGRIPALDPRGQNERQPMGRNRCVEKCDSKTRDGNGREDGLIHECDNQADSDGT